MPLDVLLFGLGWRVHACDCDITAIVEPIDILLPSRIACAHLDPTAHDLVLLLDAQVGTRLRGWLNECSGYCELGRTVPQCRLFQLSVRSLRTGLTEGLASRIELAAGIVGSCLTFAWCQKGPFRWLVALYANADKRGFHSMCLSHPRKQKDTTLAV